jgi:hypothetical protein
VRRLIYECRCDERLKTKSEGSTRLTYTGLHGGLEHLKIETSDLEPSVSSIFIVIRSDVVLTRMLTTFDMSCEENAVRR